MKTRYYNRGEKLNHKKRRKPKKDINENKKINHLADVLKEALTGENIPTNGKINKEPICLINTANQYKPFSIIFKEAIHNLSGSEEVRRILYKVRCFCERANKFWKFRELYRI